MAQEYREFGSLVKRGDSVQARYRRYGKAHHKTFRGRDAAARAKDWLREERAKLDAGGHADRRKTGFRRYVMDVAPRYEARVAKSSWGTISGHLAHAGEHFGDRPVASIGFKEADEYLALVGKGDAGKDGKPRPRSATTVLRFCTTLSRVFRYAVREGFTTLNPFRGLDLERPHKPFVRYLAPREVKVLLDRLAGELRLFAEFAYETGMRRGEVTALLLGDLVVEGERPHVLVRVAKSGEGRVVPLTASDGVTRGGLAVAIEVLERPRVRSLSEPERLWTHGDDYYTHRFARAMRDAGRAGTRLHDLRHACASRLVNSGVPIQDAQAWLGHKTIVTTRRYLHSAEDALFRAADVVAHRRPRSASRKSS